MIKLKFWDQFSLQHAFVVAASVFIAVLVNRHAAFSKEAWIILSAFLVTQTTIGTPFRQGFIVILAMISAIFIGSMLKYYVINSLILYSILALIFMVGSFLAYINRFQSVKLYFAFIIFVFILVIVILAPEKHIHPIHYRIYDVLIGALIGMICSIIVSPIKLEHEFAKGVTPLLKKLIDYSSSLSKVFLKHEKPLADVLAEKNRVKETLQAREGIYPEWVYEVGFNPGLRAGFRFFLLKLEQMTELFFSLDYLILHPIDANLLQDMDHFIAGSMEKNTELLTAIIAYFQGSTKALKGDLMSDVVNLENALRHVVPDNVELINVSDDYIILTAFVRNIKDIRLLLLQLLQALPAPS